MTKKQDNQVTLILSYIVLFILLLVPLLFVLGWYILFYGGLMVLVYVFKIGLALLILSTLSWWVGMLGYAVYKLKEEGF